MSLKHAAKHLAAHGRGPDTELIHMTKGEINSLQHLAKANGGSLTINPHTGLAEAGFLSSILPMAAGAAAMYFSGGTAAPLLGGLGVGMSSAGVIGTGIGALQYARTGSLQKGLMAGLGAYGGAGLAGGLMSAGTAQASNAIGASAEKAGEEAATQEIARQKAIEQAAINSPTAQNLDALSRMNAIGTDAATQSAREYAANAYAPTAAQTAALNSPLSTGLGGLADASGRTAFSNAVTGMGSSVGKLGLAAAAPMLASALQPKTQQPQITDDSQMPQRLQYNPGAATTPFPQPDVPAYGDQGRSFGRQQNYFPNAGFQNITPEQAKQIRGYAAGGLMPTQGGGPVEQMSNANAVGANTGFPMADINKPAYATPWQTPVSQNVVQGSADTGVNSMTGEQNEFATGGVTTNPDVFGYGDQGQNFSAERMYAPTTVLPKLTPPVAKSLGYEGYEAMPVSGDSSAPTPGEKSEDRGSPTGSVGWDFANAIANQPISQIAAAVAQHAVDNYSPIGQYSVNAVNGLDRASDMATARGEGISVSDRGIGSGFGNDATSAGYTNGSDMASDSYSSNSDSDSDSGGDSGGGDSGGGDSGGGDSGGGEANGGLSPYFPRHMARGGLSAAASHLGDYSDGGRLLKGPGDGVSDSIPATIGNKRPARLADGEFVVPARIVSELGNGSTEAGARKLYAMLDRVQAARKKSIGKGKVAKNSRADKLLPA